MPRVKNKTKRRHDDRNPYTVMDEGQLQRPARLCRKLDTDASRKPRGFAMHAARRARQVVDYQNGFDAHMERQAARAQRTIRIERRDRGA